MNERIKELAKQARQIGEYVNYGQIRLSPEQFEQKFAELLIRECADVALQEEHDPSDCILGHFGLKRWTLKNVG